MKAFLCERDTKIIARFLAGKLSREDLAFKLVPILTLEIIRRYLRVEVEGAEHLPKSGPYIVVSNHSGYSGFDAIMLANEIRRHTSQLIHTVAHKLWFLGKPVRVVSEKMGLVEADMNESLKILQSSEPLLLFPEGEAGNFKPSSRRYHLQEFKRGFVRLGMLTNVPIVPAFVLGAEETHINLSQIKFTKYLIGTVIPVPLNVIPLPVKWKIKFLPPISMAKYSADDVQNRKLCVTKARSTRHLIQRQIIAELRAHAAAMEPARLPTLEV
jgi:1-acyl-sn-glycerol-3-phosphate acyltransferase